MRKILVSIAIIIFTNLIVYGQVLSDTIRIIELETSFGSDTFLCENIDGVMVTDLYVKKGLRLNGIVESFQQLEYQYKRSLNQCNGVLNVYKDHTTNMNAELSLLRESNADFSAENVILEKDNFNLKNHVDRLKSQNRKLKFIMIVATAVGGFILL